MSITMPNNFSHLGDEFSTDLSTDLDMEISQSSQIPQIDRQQTPRPQQLQAPDILEQLQFQAHHDQNTLAIGILAYLNRVEQDLAQMKEFIHTGYKRLNDVGDEGNLVGKVEGARLEARNWNKIHVTELEEPFRNLPQSNGEYPSGIPNLGSILRAIDHKAVDYILDVYDLPFVPTMFLMEKKIIYLHFLGANQVIMHRILD